MWIVRIIFYLFCSERSIVSSAAAATLRGRSVRRMRQTARSGRPSRRCRRSMPGRGAEHPAQRRCRGRFYERQELRGGRGPRYPAHSSAHGGGTGPHRGQTMSGRAAPQGDERHGAAISRSVKVRNAPDGGILSSGKAVLHTATSRNEARAASPAERTGRAPAGRCAHGDLEQRASSGADRGRRHCDDGKLGKAAAQGVDGLGADWFETRRRMAGFFAVKAAEHLQQHGVQGRRCRRWRPCRCAVRAGAAARPRPRAAAPWRP